MLRVSLVLCCALLPLTGSTEAPGPVRVSELSWLTGAWSGPLGDRTLEEHWLPPAGGAIAGVVRFLGADGMSMIELIVIEEENNSLVFRVQQWHPGYLPRQPQPQVMQLDQIGERRVSFTGDGSGDFRRLTYSRPAEDAFNIDVETSTGETFQINLRPL